MTLAFNFLIMILGMIGGQVQKAARRYGIPTVTLMATMFQLISKNDSKKDKLKYLCFGLLIPLLSMGYGVNSWLMKVFKKDWIVRVAYGSLLSIPFAIYLLLVGAFGFKYIVCIIALAGAWSVRAGAIGSWRGFDFLIEDMIRYFTLGRLIIYVT